MSKATQADLARRIRTAQPVDKLGRYDGASKVEVKAYVREEVEGMVQIQIEEVVRKFEARIAELELSIWAKFKRWVGTLVARWYDTRQPETITQAPTSIVIKQGDSPKVHLTGEQIAAALEKHAQKQGGIAAAAKAAQ